MIFVGISMLVSMVLKSKFKKYAQVPLANGMSGKEVAEKMVVVRILRKYGARVVSVRPDFTVFESSGHTEDTEELVKKLSEYNLVEFVRGARVAIMKESEGFHKRLKEFEYKEPGEEVIENEFLEKGEKIFTM